MANPEGASKLGVMVGPRSKRQRWPEIVYQDHPVNAEEGTVTAIMMSDVGIPSTPIHFRFLFMEATWLPVNGPRAASRREGHRACNCDVHAGFAGAHV